MGIIESLMQDHRHIKRMLGILEAMCLRIRTGDSPDPGHLNAAVKWIHAFVDGWHLNREEILLFPLLAKSHVQDDPIASMLGIHKRERRLVAEMARATSRARCGRDGAHEAFCMAAMAYIKLISEHIRKEEDEYYRQAKSVLDGRKRKELRMAWRNLEKEIGGQRYEKMMATLRWLSAVYPQKDLTR